MAIASDVLVRDQLYIGGEWGEPAGEGSIEGVNPTTQEGVGRIPEGAGEGAHRGGLNRGRESDDRGGRRPHPRGDGRGRRPGGARRAGRVRLLVADLARGARP